MKRSFTFIFAAAAIAFSANALNAQTRDYLTPEEVEIIRDKQAIDGRIEALVHMIDRRFAALGIQPGEVDPKKPAKPEKADLWGPSPAGTRTQLFSDIKQILQKAVDDIDNLSSRPDSMFIDQDVKKEKRKTFSDLFPKAVRSLATASQRYQPLLKTEMDKPETSNDLRGILLYTLDLTDQIIASVAKLPAETQKAKN